MGGCCSKKQKKKKRKALLAYAARSLAYLEEEEKSVLSSTSKIIVPTKASNANISSNSQYEGPEEVVVSFTTELERAREHALVEAQKFEMDMHPTSSQRNHDDDLSWIRDIPPPNSPDSFPPYVTAPVEEMHKKVFVDVFQILMDDGLFFNSKKGRRCPPFEYLAPDELRKQIDFSLPESPVAHDKLLQLIRLIIKYMPHVGHPYFMGHHVAGLEPYSCISDMVATCTNSNNILYMVSMVMTLLELELIRAICKLVGYDVNGHGDGTITPGSSLACGYAMRLAVKHHLPAIKKTGLSGSRRPAFFVSERNIFIHMKCAIFQGFGTDSVIPISANDDGKMNVDELRSKIMESRKQGHVPCMVVGTAGTDIVRAIDPLDKIADICREFGVWFHVDGSLGGALLCSKILRHRLTGVERSDSFTWSQHYVMGIPSTCTVLVVPPRHLHKLSHNLSPEDGTGSALVKTPLHNPRYDIEHNTIVSCRRSDMLKFWLMWKAKGIDGMGRHVDHIFRNAQICLEEMKKREGFQPIMDSFEGTNICFVYVPLHYRSIIRGSEEFKMKISRLCLSLKRVLLDKGILSLNYNELPNSKSTFLVLGLHNSAVTRKDIIYVLTQIEFYGEVLTRRKHN